MELQIFFALWAAFASLGWHAEHVKRVSAEAKLSRFNGKQAPRDGRGRFRRRVKE